MTPKQGSARSSSLRPDQSEHRAMRGLAYVGLTALVVVLNGLNVVTAADQAGTEFFEKKIRPILVERCYSCHSTQSKKTKGGLNVEFAETLRQGGDRGPGVVPGKPAESSLVQAVKYDDPDLRMPPKGKLPEAEIKLLSDWVASGAVDPRTEAGKGMRLAASSSGSTTLWSFVPPAAITIPGTSGESMGGSPIDRFINAKLKEKGLVPNPISDRRRLIRRATLDLTGLPPTPEEVGAFLSDDSPNAFEKLVDRLLDSPRYGERWARHWLDVARYADSNGLDENVAHGNAWRYRDYVISALNKDKPYDLFIKEQIAGDLLPRPASRAEQVERLVATGFLALGAKVLAEVDETKMEMDIVDEQIDTVGKAFLGMTLGCARCHDHKFDPIGTDDYYGLAGIFRGTKTMESFKKVAKWHENPIGDDESIAAVERHKKRIDALRADIAKVVAREIDRLKQAKAKSTAESSFAPEVVAELKKKRADLATLEKETPEIPSAMGVVDGSPTDVKIHLRGSHLTLGKLVSRRVPVALAGREPRRFPEKSSGRLELAEWIASPDNPLTARVVVNRVWARHFGRGLVASVDNFGRLGDKPTHPELLDWLALKFVSSGWSLKKLHREIMLSAAYRRASTSSEAPMAVDPENLLLWRFAPRRLEAEAIRDAVLFVSGRLDHRLGGSTLTVKNRGYFFDHTSKDTTNYDINRRSVYLPVVRNHLYDGFDLFDYNDAGMSFGTRAVSTVAPQALFFLNSPLLMDSARAMARELSREKEDRSRIVLLYRRCLQRDPDAREIQAASEFLTAVGKLKTDGSRDPADDPALAALCQTVLMSSDFLYLE